MIKSKEKITKKLINKHLHANDKFYNLKIVFDDEQAEHLTVQNGTVLGIIGRYECCWF